MKHPILARTHVQASIAAISNDRQQLAAETFLVGCSMQICFNIEASVPFQGDTCVFIFINLDTKAGIEQMQPTGHI